MNGQPTGARLNRRQQRQIRQQKIRTTLLSLCIVIILLLVTLAIFLFCAIADELNQDTGDHSTPPNVDSSLDSSIRYSTISKNNQEIHVGDLLLVNNDHYFDPESAQDLILIDGTQGNPKTYTVAYPSWKLNAATLNAFNKMMGVYYEISGDGGVKISSAYRSAADQEGKTTPVGYSDHHTGYCLALRKVDGGYLEDTHWIYENGHRYGFIQRYPNEKSDKTYVSDYEYCIRYVGIPHATYMAQNDLCLEEYVALLRSSYTGSNHLSITGGDGKSYEVYYVSASAESVTSLEVPQNYAFTISGDNVGGFIVTVDLSQRLA